MKVAERLDEGNGGTAALKLRAGTELRRLWVGTLAQPWRVLALVPAHEGLKVSALGRGVCEVGSGEGGAEVTLVDGCGLDLPAATRLAAELRKLREAGGRVILTVDSPEDRPPAVPLALEADAVVIGLQQGRTTREQVRRVLRHLGGRRVLGCVLLEAEEP